MKQTKNKQIAVLISDVHFNISTLAVAEAAMKQAIATANKLNIPLFSCGDLHDTKALLRGECVRTILALVKSCEVKPVILIGNHSRINEKSREHSLEFLQDRAYIVDTPAVHYGVQFLPYDHDSGNLRDVLGRNSTEFLIMHQGIQGSNAGEYYQDKSALNKEDLAGRRVVSGHYHTRQSFPLPNNGIFDYVGNPFTLGFGEANDPEKGYQILYDDGSLEFIPTNLRRHRIIELEIGELDEATLAFSNSDILWIKIKGKSDELAKITKKIIATKYGVTQPFRFDLIPTDLEVKETATHNKSQPEILDAMIDSTNEDLIRKQRLKTMWKTLV